MLTMRKRKAEREPCALVLALKKLGGWKLLVLRELCKQPRRFSDFKKLLPVISSTSLARTLKALEDDAFIVRNVVQTRPLVVSYSLEIDEPLLREVIESLTRFGKRYAQRRLPSSS